jgi:hypothetical protein
VPNTPSTNCYIRANVTDTANSNQTTSAISQEAFTIAPFSILKKSWWLYPELDDLWHAWPTLTNLPRQDANENSRTSLPFDKAQITSRQTLESSAAPLLALMLPIAALSAVFVERKTRLQSKRNAPRKRVV